MIYDGCTPTRSPLTTHRSQRTLTYSTTASQSETKAARLLRQWLDQRSAFAHLHTLSVFRGRGGVRNTLVWLGKARRKWGTRICGLGVRLLIHHTHVRTSLPNRPFPQGMNFLSSLIDLFQDQNDRTRPEASGTLLTHYSDPDRRGGAMERSGYSFTS